MRIPRSFVLILLIASTLAPAQTPAPAVKPKEPPFAGYVKSPTCGDHHVFHSAALDREMAYCVLLPQGYEAGKDSYPVLYLLHGLWGDENDWTAKTKIAEHARPLKVIVIMPEGDDAWYTNSATDPRNRYEDYIATDLIREIESKYRVQASRSSRFIAGLSMGGYGAIKLGLKHPELYSFVGAFSAASLSAIDRSQFRTPALAFGPLDGPARRENNLYLLAAKADPKALPYFILTCGISDSLRGDDLQMADLMRVLGIRYEYIEFPGAHQWPVWDRSIAIVLDDLRTAQVVAEGK